MLRIFAALLLAALPAAASGQGFSRPASLPPGVTPAMLGPFGGYAPGGFGYGARLNFGAGVRPLGGFGYGYGGSGLGYGYGPVYGGYVPTFSPFDLPVSAAPAPAPVAASPASDASAIAEVVIEFPAEVELTVNGRAEPGSGPERAVRTAPLKIGATATLKLRATWKSNGQAFEWDREVTLGRGEFSRLSVARGFPVRP